MEPITAAGSKGDKGRDPGRPPNAVQLPVWQRLKGKISRTNSKASVDSSSSGYGTQISSNRYEDFNEEDDDDDLEIDGSSSTEEDEEDSTEDRQLTRRRIPVKDIVKRLSGEQQQQPARKRNVQQQPQQQQQQQPSSSPSAPPAPAATMTDRETILEFLKPWLPNVFVNEEVHLTIYSDSKPTYLKIQLLLGAGDEQESRWFSQQDQYFVIKGMCLVADPNHNYPVAVIFPKTKTATDHLGYYYQTLIDIDKNNVKNVQKFLAKGRDFIVCKWHGVPLTSTITSLKSRNLLEALSLFLCILDGIQTGSPWPAEFQMSQLLLSEEEDETTCPKVVICPSAPNIKINTDGTPYNLNGYTALRDTCSGYHKGQMVTGNILANILNYLIKGLPIQPLPSNYNQPNWGLSSPQQCTSNIYDIQLGNILDRLRSCNERSPVLKEIMADTRALKHRLERLRDDNNEDLLEKACRQDPPVPVKDIDKEGQPIQHQGRELTTADLYELIDTGPDAFQPFRAVADEAIVVQAANNEDASFVIFPAMEAGGGGGGRVSGANNPDTVYYEMVKITPASNMTLLMAVQVLSANTVERLKLFRCLLNPSMICPSSDMTSYMVSHFNQDDMKINCINNCNDIGSITCHDMFALMMTPVGLPAVDTNCRECKTYEQFCSKIDMLIDMYDRTTQSIEMVLDKVSA